jgi:hypothetical protein
VWTAGCSKSTKVFRYSRPLIFIEVTSVLTLPPSGRVGITESIKRELGRLKSTTTVCCCNWIVFTQDALSLSDPWILSCTLHSRTSQGDEGALRVIPLAPLSFVDRELELFNSEDQQ